MKKKKIQNKKQEKQEIINAVPVVSKIGSKGARISYYTESGKEIPQECVGKFVQDITLLGGDNMNYE